MKAKILIPLAGLALFCACSRSRSKYDASGSADSAKIEQLVTSRAINPDDTIKSHLKQVKTADMRFQVKSVQQATEQITSLTAGYGGTVVHHWMKSTPVDSTEIRKSNDSVIRVTAINSVAEMTVRIPPPNVEDFMNKVATLGIYVKARRMDVTDKTLDYLGTRLKLKNQHEYTREQHDSGANKKTADEMLAFKNGIVDQQLNNRKIDDSVRNSVIILSFYEDNTIRKTLIANNDLSAYNLSFGKRLELSLNNGWTIFADMIIGIANCWFLLPIGLAGWWIVRYYQKHKKTPAKAEA